MLSNALGGLRVVAEQYPELRATENFQQLQRQLTELEDEIQASRRIYNSNVQAYNTKIQVFPNSIVAGSGGFTAREFFEIADAAEREPTQVSFSYEPHRTAAPAARPRRRNASTATPAPTAGCRRGRPNPQGVIVDCAHYADGKRQHEGKLELERGGESLSRGGETSSSGSDCTSPPDEELAEVGQRLRPA